MSRPEVIAHRGVVRGVPENSIAAFRAALALGVDGIELDVHATADGVVVVHHDPLLPAPDDAGKGAPIARLSWQALHRETTEGRHIPTLDEVLEEVNARCMVYVEIKAPRIEAQVCRALRTRSAWCAVHSFDHRTIARAQALAPGIPGGVLMSSYLMDPLGPLRDTGARDLWQHVEMVDEELVRRVHGMGRRLIVWTVNAPDDISRLSAWSVNGLAPTPSELPRSPVRVGG
jgi:glycerophosphoryl diester phosphodiesterase